MLYPIEKLIEGRPDPLCVHLHQKVADALELMIKNDYSQLPVVDDQGYLTGVISDQSIIRTYYHERAAVSLLDLTVDHCRDRASTISPESDLFDALDQLKAVYSVVVVKDRKPCGIVTNYDLTQFFRDLSEGLIRVEDIEMKLRYYTEAAFPTENKKAAALMRAFGADRKDPRKPARDYDKLGLGDQLQLITCEENWVNFQGVFEPRDLFSTLMDQIRQVRNQLAHFRDRLDPVQLSALVRTQDWLEARPRLSSMVEADTRTIRALPQDAMGDSTADPLKQLTEFLQNSVESGHAIDLRFDVIKTLVSDVFPPSAWEHSSWWENDHTSNPYAITWLRAGCEVVNVDVASRFVSFRQSDHALMFLFFTDLIQRLKERRPGITRASRVYLQNWWSFSAGRSGFLFSWTFPKDGTFRVELYIDIGDAKLNKAVFDELVSQKEHIERDLNAQLNWERLDHRRASRISIAHPISIAGSAEQLDSVKQWAIDVTIKFIDAFQPIIKNIKVG
jgi:CBS domain-containing protein